MNKSKPSILHLATLFLIGLYFFLCLTHFSFQRPLWNDESCVFLSIQQFSQKEIFTRTMLADQVFPRTYLFFIQSFSTIFNFHPLSLRLPSLICMFIAFFLWLKIAKIVFKSELERFIFVLCWCASIPLVYYSAELKQYSMDLMAGALFLLFLFKQQQWQASEDKKKFGLTLMALPFLGLFSYPALMLSFLPLYNLCLYAKNENKKHFKYVLLYGTSMAIVILISYFFDMRLRPIKTVTDGFGDYFISFASFGEFFKTLGEGVNNLFSRYLAEHPKVLKKFVRSFMTFGLFYMFYAFFKNFKKQRYYLNTLNVLAFAIFLELFMLGALKKYPFTVPRTSLFFSPIVFFLTIKGIGVLKDINKPIYYIINTSFIIFLIALTVGLTNVVLFQYLGGQSALW